MKQSIRVGNQTAHSASSIMQPFEYAVSSGFDAFEWFPDKTETGEGWAVQDLSKEARGRIKEIARDNDIRLSVHVPWQADPLHEEDRVLLSGAVELAEDIGASLVNIHFFNQDGPALYAKAILPLLEHLRPKGIALSIENTPLTGPTAINLLFNELRRLGSMDNFQVGMCLDLGHANLCEETRNDYVRFLDILDSRVPIVHIHMHENYGDADSHLLIFTGPAGRDDSGIRGFLRRIKKRDFSGSIIFEQWPEPPSLLNQSRDRLLSIIHDLEREKKSPESLSTVGRTEFAKPFSLGKEDNFAVEIARSDRQFHSWRKKLAWIHDYFETNPEPDIGHLVYLAVYLRFIGTGRICLGEDGGHYRPSHHAGIARRIHGHLLAMTTPENAFIIRKIYPWLPSFDSAFARAEPLTRIRDIAHRNDIPQGLKKEIKTTLQNKLHRCAGPEDLDTSRQLLERITAPDAPYPAGFVAEFKRFHEELKEFFNARSIEEQLHGISNRGYTKLSIPIRNFLLCKEKTETLNQQLSALKALTSLRTRLSRELINKTGAAAQELQMADIKLEDYGFVLIGRLANRFETSKRDLPWAQVLISFRLSARNLRLSGFDAAECMAIESELQAWSRELDVQDPVQLIRLKATLERIRRLSEFYSNRILKLYPERVKRLGALLGVDEQAVSVFAESDIRSHLVFQVSRIVAIALKKIRDMASLPRWDVIVPGTARGRLVEASNLEDLSSSDNGLMLALLEKVEGDEEIPTGVVSLIVARETPHLSHLAVRARQSGVVFVVCEDPDCFSRLRRFAGQHLELKAVPEKVDFNTTSEFRTHRMPEDKTEARRPAVIAPEVKLLHNRGLLTLQEVTASTGGGKAFAATRLQEISGRRGAGFETPGGIVIPFGVQEELMNSDTAFARRYAELLLGMNELSPENLVKTAQELESIIQQLRLPESILSGIAQNFSRKDRLMVRSSSNMEDMKGFPGAGQYESVANVELADVAAAVLNVWASLWTSRAVMGRRNLFISQDKARMAVLIQQMIVPGKLSFIMHTVNPVSFNRDEAYVELAVGMGETLALAETEGTPYRIACHKAKESVRILAFADFSRALWPGSSGHLVGKPVDYSTIEFSRDQEYRQRLGFRLGRIARFVEDAMGQPQDIEGLISGDTVYLVQSRPQQGRV
jgi:phosphoglucan,water dikinase